VVLTFREHGGDLGGEDRVESAVPEPGNGLDRLQSACLVAIQREQGRDPSVY